MCDARVIAAVRGAVSRAAVPSAGALAAAGSAVARPVPPLARAVPLPALAFAPGGPGGITDLTHTLTPDFPTFSGRPTFAMRAVAGIGCDGYNEFELTLHEHTGTHIDAPLHVTEGGDAVELLRPEDLVAPLVRIDIAGRAERDADATVTPDDIRRWVADHGPLPERCCVAMHSGWARHVGSARFRNADGDGRMHFPGFHPETAALLLARSSAVGIAVDTLSLDPGVSADFPVHAAWLGAGRWGLECVAGLDLLPPAGTTIVVGAPKHAGGTGGPTRAFALG